MEYGQLTGLTEQQVEESRKLHGANKVEIKRQNRILHLLKRAAGEPMLLLLIATSAIYFFTNAYAEGFFLLIAVLIISFISFYQESRSKKALDSLATFTRPKSKVIRNGSVGEINTEDIVQGDLFIVEEGNLIPADGTIVQANDFSVNESILTGESLAVAKASGQGGNSVFQGTQVMSGSAVCLVTGIGEATQLGRIGKSVEQIRDQASPLEIQISHFVKKMAIVGVCVFAFILLINFYRDVPFRENLLKGLTLAMSILPEEIPVAFATFMALGAWRLMQMGIIVKQTKTVETLGSATVICVDKTGTLTKNEMSLACVYTHSSGKIVDPKNFSEASDVISAGMWASERVPFDPMEKALHDAYEKVTKEDQRHEFEMVHEYPLSGTPPFMTHVFRDSRGNQIIAAKGAPEALISLCELSTHEKEIILQSFHEMAIRGFRVLGVADGSCADLTLPKGQHEFKFAFKGLVAFYDPPKENISSVLTSFYNAGVKVKIITGDNAVTTSTIARQINFKSDAASVTGEQIENFSDQELFEVVRNTTIFTRMFPDAKLKVVETLKKQNNIVAMTGDGVNDAAALKAAHIGIAMGKKGSEVAKQASDLILMNDDLAGLVSAIAMGRQIYSNLKKAVQYIISIHIPIILIVFVPLLLGWIYPAIFTPVHVIFLELIMGPTCSIIYENEPMEQNVMNDRPRQFSKTFFRTSELVTSIVQGLIITMGLIFVYWVGVMSGASLAATTSMVFVTMIMSNIGLTLVNRSFNFSIAKTIRYKNRLIPLIIGITIAFVILIFSIQPLRNFFRFEPLQWKDVLTCIATGVVSVIWFEGYKWMKRVAQASATAGSDVSHPATR